MPKFPNIRNKFLAPSAPVAPDNLRYGKLHFGCGKRIVEGWLNVDMAGSDWDLDLTKLPLPFPDRSFECVASQHVIEHLEMEMELKPLLRDLKRVMKPGGAIWLSCPDMEKVCQGYIRDRGTSLLKDIQSRHPKFDLGGAPQSHVINHLFHQKGEHKNLFDFELLQHVLISCGFSNVIRASEDEMRRNLESFPIRGDDHLSLYVVASA